MPWLEPVLACIVALCLSTDDPADGASVLSLQPAEIKTTLIRLAYAGLDG
jgi:hypothetical protein